ncbi:lipocalin-like domain-containing protein [Parahaliea mediterranea]|uniref:Lipocalin-like domain-containing protein n=1 Tax=Parahaliea mediterranea TaxID=651086 RepID=A0A939DCX2_9GAMM|nr:lipocalin-like domain-containing protein [Parahaliea mediterranea]MBN7795611.1 lipocalin-like domain-containing protein [Parahaliea mediterranea]
MIKSSDLTGAWQLESWSIGYSDRDELSTPFGEDPQGLLLYTADGWMSASICRADRDRFPAGQSPRTIDDGQKAAAYSSYFHYAGRYRVVDGDVIHYVSQSLNPNFPGSEQLRHAELDGHTLVLSGKDEMAGVTRYHSLVWHRVSNGEAGDGA